MVVKVTDQISALDVSLTCPNVTTTKTTVSCDFAITRGSSLTGSFNYNSTDGPRPIARVPGKIGLVNTKQCSMEDFLLINFRYML